MRPVHQRVALRYPNLARALFALGLSLPGRRARNAVVLYGLRDSDRAFNRGDLEAALGALAPSVEFPLPPIFPGAEVLRGSAAVHAYFSEALGEWTDVRLWHERVIEANRTRIVAVWTLDWTGTETGLRLHAKGTQALEVRSGLVVRVVADVRDSATTGTPAP